MSIKKAMENSDNHVQGKKATQKRTRLKRKPDPSWKMSEIPVEIVCPMRLHMAGIPIKIQFERLFLYQEMVILRILSVDLYTV